MKVIVNQDECIGCLRCREILCIDRDDGIIMMPELGFGLGHQVNRRQEGAEELLDYARSECPTGALRLEA